MAETYALICRDPFTEILPFETEVDRFFTDALSIFDLPIYVHGPLISESRLVAPMEVFDRDGQTVVRLEAPGVSMKDIDISVSNGMLTIKGEKKLEEEIKSGDCYCSERSYGSFRRTLSVSKDIDESKIHATYDNGVLEIVLPKAEEKKGHKVEIQAKS